MSKRIWTINVLVNTQFVRSLEGTGSWDSPVGKGSYWGKNVTIVAKSNELKDGVIIGDGDSFSLRVKPEDEIRWVLSEMQPLREGHRKICMYGFNCSNEPQWLNQLTPLSSTFQESGHVYLKHGFNSPDQPNNINDKLSKSLISEVMVPTATVRTEPKEASEKEVRYYIKLLLVNTNDHKKPIIEKYAQVDPVITIDR
ncbi:MAG: hypothetical protein OIF57_06935 [Marinobacterium sp.]|nr:hypothetical protein [Marinobacterium sp.]